MAQSAFQILVQFEQARFLMTYSQMIGTTDFVSRPWLGYKELQVY